MNHSISINPDAGSLRIGIAVSSYHKWATDKMLEGAITRWKLLGGLDDNLIVVPASGAWELVGIAKALCGMQLDAVVALGVVIQGETPHFSYICDGVTKGLMDITVQIGKPVGYGLLTCENTQQVEARCGGAIGNKGADAMSAAVASALAIREIGNL